jgi:putative oxidoreductase
MNTINGYLRGFARILLALIFLINGFGIIDPSVSIHDMVAGGIPAQLAPALSMGGRILEIVAGVGLALGLYPGICAAALIAFLIPATLIGHPFWIAPSQLFQVQLINFLKNLSTIGGLLLIASMRSQTTWTSGIQFKAESLARHE